MKQYRLNQTVTIALAAEIAVTDAIVERIREALTRPAKVPGNEPSSKSRTCYALFDQNVRSRANGGGSSVTAWAS